MSNFVGDDDGGRKDLSARLSALREHPRRAGRYLVDLDGAPLGAVSVELIAELGLRAGQMIGAAQRERLEQGVPLIACYDRALDALARRARSRADLGRWLRTKEFTAAEIEPALEKLTDLGLLDDEAFARSFARTRLSLGRGFGPRRVMAELARRGVARGTIDSVMRELGEEGVGDELTSADAVAARKLRTLKGLEPDVVRRRLYGFLARRGFGNDAIRRVLDRLH